MAVGKKVELDPETKEKMGIYGIELHEIRQVSDTVAVLRVPGGWLYGWTQESGFQSTVFVPYSRNVDEDTAMIEKFERSREEPSRTGPARR